MKPNEHAPGYMPNDQYTQEDWDEVCDNPELTDEQLAQGRPLVETMPELVAAIRRSRGPQKSPTKELVAPRPDRDVLAKFRATGSGCQTRLNEILKQAVGGWPS